LIYFEGKTINNNINSIAYIFFNMNRNDRQKREWSATAEVPAEVAVSMPVVMSCASMHESYHWPGFKSMEENYELVFNCLQYELSDGAHMVMSADAKGIHASGASAEESIEDFSQAIKTRLADKLGGLYPGTSHFEFQELYFRDMERGWMNDGVQINQKRQISISM
jgi:predicted RNase H-like HicB family nuclease